MIKIICDCCGCEMPDSNNREKPIYNYLMTIEYKRGDLNEKIERHLCPACYPIVRDYIFEYLMNAREE